MEGNDLTLEEKCLQYRSAVNYKLPTKSYVLMMLDGKNFSSYTRSLNKPFDEGFIEDMNETAMFLCKNIEGCKLAYTQSDEISLLITDFDNKNTQAWFDFRLNKILPIAASMAATKFNQLRILRGMKKLDKCFSCEDYQDSLQYNQIFVNSLKLAQFDAKAWSVPSKNDAFCWFLYRQNDCVRNSVSMLAQSKFSHSELNKKNVSEQQQMVIDKYGINWDDLSNRLKYGGFFYRKDIELINKDTNIPFNRKKWVMQDGVNLNQDRDWLIDLIPNKEI